MAEKPEDQPLEQPAEQAADQSVWVPVAAAARRLGVTQQAIRARIDRGTIDVKHEPRGNKPPRLLVRVDQTFEQCVDQAHRELEERVLNALAQRLDQLVEQRIEVLFEQRLADKDQHIADLQAENARLRAALDRRRWPGLQRLWRQLWEGTG